MSLDSKITFDNNHARVNELNRLYEIDTTYPPLNSEQNISIYVQPLTLNNDGITTDMKVDGSATPQEFSIQSEEGFDIFINSVSFFINAQLTLTDLGEFGGTPALTNGCELIYESLEVGIISIGSDLKTNFDLLRMTTMNPSIGLESNSAFKVLQTASNQDEGYLFILRFNDYGYETDYAGGLKLSSQDRGRLLFRVRDNLNLTPSELFKLDAVAYGFKKKI